jgi:hypothetical protein
VEVSCGVVRIVSGWQRMNSGRRLGQAVDRVNVGLEWDSRQPRLFNADRQTDEQLV